MADEPQWIELRGSCSEDASDPEGGTPEKFEIVSQPAHGTIEELDMEQGWLVYNPDHHYIGGDSFSFRATNGRGSSAVRTMAVEMKAPDLPNCDSTTVVVAAHVSTGLYLSCEGEHLEYVIDAGPSHGSISKAEGPSLHYTSSGEFIGGDTIEFHAVNAAGESEKETLLIDIEAVVCSDGFRTTVPGEPVILAAGSLFCEGEEPLTYSIVSGPEHGSFSGFDPGTGAVTYVPESEFSGLDSLTFRAGNTLGESATASFTLAVGNPPQCEDIQIGTGAEQPKEVTLDCEGLGEMGFELNDYPEHGAISEVDWEAGTLVYTPDPGYRGLDSFTYRGWDMIGQSESATVSITVEPRCTDVSSSVASGNPVSIELPCDGAGTLTFHLDSEPAHGRSVASTPRLESCPTPQKVNS
jgi:large repetitive protein